MTEIERAYLLVLELLDGLTAQTMALSSILPSRCYTVSREWTMTDLRAVLTVLGEEPPDVHDNAAARRSLELMLVSRARARAHQVDRGREYADRLNTNDRTTLVVVRDGALHPLADFRDAWAEYRAAAAKLAKAGLIEVIGTGVTRQVRITLAGFVALILSEARVAS